MNPSASASRDTPSKIASTAVSSNERVVKHKRRYCRVEGCDRIVKSQGLCQRHGAKTRKCKVEYCDKQAQGNNDGMCKSHFHQFQQQPDAASAPAGVRETAASEKQPASEKRAALEDQATLEDHAATEDHAALLAEQVATELAATAPSSPHNQGSSVLISVFDKIVPDSLSWNADSGPPMPLIEHLRRGVQERRPFGWHRNAERQAQGLSPVDEFTQELEEWEQELVWTEVLLMAGDSTGAFAALSHGWGREDGFHTSVVRLVCERRSNLGRLESQSQASVAARASLPTNQDEETKHFPDLTDADWAALWEDGSDKKMNEYRDS